MEGSGQGLNKGIIPAFT